MSPRTARVCRIVALLVTTMVIAAALCSPIRFLTGVSIKLSLAVAVLPSLALIAIVGFRTQPKTFSPRTLLYAAGCAALAVALLWSRAFGPIPAWVGSDAGVHVAVRTEFIELHPQVYGGFVSMLGFTWWIERLLRTRGFVSFGIAFNLVFAAIAVTMAWATRRAAGTARAPIWRRTLAELPALGLMGWLALPLAHYYQIDGFWPQLWGLLPVLGVWIVDASDLPAWRRLALIVTLCVFARYTYGLVIGDLTVLIAFLSIVESIAAVRKDRRWWPILIVAVGVCVAAWFAAKRFFGMLEEVIPRYGWFIRYDVTKAMWGTAAAALFLVVVSLGAPRLFRLVRVPIVIAAANSAALYELQRRFPGEHYYLSKYNFHAVVLIALAVGAAWAYAVHAADVSSWWARGVRIAAGMAAIVALQGVVTAFAPIYAGYKERVLGAYASEHTLAPLEDTAAIPRIRERLAEAHAKFGGYLVPFGPMFNFMNAELGHYGGGYFAYEGFDRRPGHCVFWAVHLLNGWEPWGLPEWMAKTFSELNAMPTLMCRSYRAGWDTSIPRKLCSACY